MAVELRCPDCRAKLRLKAAPEAGTEVECPKCGTVFPAPDAEGDEDAPKKKKKSAADEEKDAAEETVKELKNAKDSDDKTEKPAKKGKKGAKDPNVPRKRKAKKVETSKVALIGVIATGVLMVFMMTGVLIWFFTRTTKAVEMMYYVPEDAQTAMGMNLGHAQKYPEFYKSIKTNQEGTDYKVAGEAIAKAAGTDMDTMVDHIVKAESAKNGWAIVYRTKEPFDVDALGKLAGAQKKSADGKTYYAVPNLLPGQPTGLTFAPTNRLIVVCPGSMDNQPAFRKMLNGHADSKEKTLGVRMGALGNRTTRGTFWQMIVFDNEMKIPTAPPPTEGQPAPGGDDSKAQLARTIVDTANGAQGFGFKASLGSREVRFELIVWYKDSEKSSGVAKKWKESELGKGDEGTPPKWFKEESQSWGDRKVAAQLLSNIGFGSSGELFYARSSVETVDLQQSASGVVGKVTGQQRAGGGGGGPAPGPGPGPGPKGPRRRKWVRR